MYNNFITILALPSLALEISSGEFLAIDLLRLLIVGFVPISMHS